MAIRSGTSSLLSYVPRIMGLDRVSYLFFFLAGIILRAIPDMLVTPYPVGYETITWYAPIMTRFQTMSVFDVFAETVHAGPLFYVLMWFAAAVSGANTFVLLKVTGTLLYGCLAMVFFVFLRRGLRFEWKIAFVSSLLLVFQVPALRMSWDRFRTIMGLIFVFLGLTVLKSCHKFKWPLMAGLAVLTMLSREYVAMILFVPVLSFAFLEGKERLLSLIALAPALTMFVAKFLSTEFLWSVFSDGTFALNSYLWTVRDVLAISAVCFLCLLPFVLKGFRRDRLLVPFTGFLLLGSFSVVLFPWFVIPGYQRWLMLLVFPFTAYAGLGFERFHLFERGGFKKLVAIFLIFMVIGVGYCTGAFSYVGLLPNSYVATNLVQSSIPWNQIDDIKDVLGWLDENAASNSSVLTEERFYGWASIYLRRANDDVEVVPYGAAFPPWTALEQVLDDDFRGIYLIWYSDSNLENFHTIYSQNDVSVFQYEL